MSSTGFVNGSTLTDAGWFNDTDTVTYQRLTSVSGTNTIVGTGPVSMTAYAVGQEFAFIPAATNTGATTLNITPSGSTALGAKNIFWNGAACVGGEIRIGVPVKVWYDGTQFNLINGGPPLMSQITNALGANVALNNTANFFDGPSVAQGTVGTWLAMGTITVGGGSASVMAIKIWDGTTVLASTTITSYAGPGANGYSVSIIGKPITSPAGNLRISVRDLSNTDNFILYDERSFTLSSSITAIRIG